MTKTERPIAKPSDLKVSFEFFPPKSPDMAEQLWQTVEALQPYQPDFVSVTYGAGGSTRDRTLGTVKDVLALGYDVAPHLSCIGSSRASLRAILEDYRAQGIKRLV